MEGFSEGLNKAAKTWAPGEMGELMAKVSRLSKKRKCDKSQAKEASNDVRRCPDRKQEESMI